MEHLVEALLWHLYDYAESYTFLFSWIALPLGFLSCFLILRRGEFSYSNPAPGQIVHDSGGLVQAEVQMSLNPRDSVVNQNENNA